VVISSRGGNRRPAPQSSHLDFLEPYLRAALGFIGLMDVIFIHAENQYRPDQAPGGRAVALQQIEQTIAGLAVVFPPNSASEYAIDLR
jgi:FMN-dependent NADH-azoreductase